MLLARLGDDPDGATGLHGCEIGDYLPQVIVVAFLQLVLDYVGVSVTAFGNDVDAEGASGLFAFC